MLTEFKATVSLEKILRQIDPFPSFTFRTLPSGRTFRLYLSPDSGNRFNSSAEIMRSYGWIK